MKTAISKIFSLANKPQNHLALVLLLFSQLYTVSYADDINPQTTFSPPPFQLGSGDLLRIFVWNHPNLSLNVPINPNGNINYPLIGELNVSGTTETQLESTIARKLRNHIKSPQVTVTLMEVHSYRVYVIGEVIHSGHFTVKGALTASQAIAMAGGFTPFASKSDILILNQISNRKVPFDFDDFMKQKPGHPDIFLRAGDTVIVN